MSMEIYVLSDRQIASISAWQKSIIANGFSLFLDDSRSFSQLQGHLPAQWQGAPAGFECDHWPPDDILDTYSEIDFGHRWKYCLAFRWGADLRSCLGGHMAAVAYAAATDGIVFISDTGKILTPAQAKAEAEKIEKELPEFERQMKIMLEKIKSGWRPGR